MQGMHTTKKIHLYYLYSIVEFVSLHSVNLIDILYTLDSASNYFAIQKLKL